MVARNEGIYADTSCKNWGLCAGEGCQYTAYRCTWDQCKVCCEKNHKVLSETLMAQKGTHTGHGTRTIGYQPRRGYHSDSCVCISCKREKAVGPEREETPNFGKVEKFEDAEYITDIK